MFEEEKEVKLMFNLAEWQKPRDKFKSPMMFVAIVHVYVN